MNLVRFNQYQGLTSLMENLERNFLGLVDENSGDIPAVNIKEENDKFVLEMVAPGMSKDDFKINFDNYQLTISSEQKKEKKKPNLPNRVKFLKVNTRSLGARYLPGFFIIYQSAFYTVDNGQIFH